MLCGSNILCLYGWTREGTRERNEQGKGMNRGRDNGRDKGRDKGKDLLDKRRILAKILSGYNNQLAILNFCCVDIIYYACMVVGKYFKCKFHLIGQRL